MTCSNIYDLKKIPIYYEELGGKKLFTKALSEIDVNKKSVHLFYYKNANIPICALPKLGVVIISKRGFLSFCYNFYFFINSFNTKNIEISKQNIFSIAKSALSHEIGHLLDPNLSNIKSASNEIILSIANGIIKYNIDLKDDYYYKKNLPLEIEDSIIQFKKNNVTREINAWNIGKTIANFQSDTERYIFEKIKEYALATYNYTNDEHKTPKLNFIANDVIVNSDGSDNKVGQLIVNPTIDAEGGILSYDLGNYISVIAGALQQAMKKIEELEKKINKQ